MPIPSSLIYDNDGTDDGIYDVNCLILKRKRGVSMNSENDGTKLRLARSLILSICSSSLILKEDFLKN